MVCRQVGPGPWNLREITKFNSHTALPADDSILNRQEASECKIIFQASQAFCRLHVTFGQPLCDVYAFGTLTCENKKPEIGYNPLQRKKKQESPPRVSDDEGLSAIS